MAMLAEPRRKQKVINLRAKNNAWSNDSNKFGQRMLEKMGWSSGKGLGAKENGIVEHVVARYKNDDKGLGFEDRNDQWTKHEDEFNSLLSNLSNATGDDEKLHSGVSLEDKSKKSKARVHYYKFTRGKDLTRYSEKDLANIFGKRSLKDKEKSEKKSEVETVKDSDLKFSEKGSMEDYFRNKLAAFKSKTNFDVKTESQSNDEDYVFKGFSAQSDENENESNAEVPKVEFSFYSNFSPEIVKENVEQNVTEDHVLDQKAKKKAKCKNTDTSNLSTEELEKQPTKEKNLELVSPMNDCGEQIKSKKKCKRKSEPKEEQLCIEEIKTKKKKSKSAKSIVFEESKEKEEDLIPKKKKKKKNK